MSDKTYLGDSVYATFDGYHIVLTTENGMEGDPSNTIALEPDVLQALSEYRKSLIQDQEEQPEMPEYFSELIESNTRYIRSIERNITKNGKAYKEVIDALGPLCMSASPDSVDLNINITGTKHDLESAWGILRRLDFDAPYKRPEANQPEYTGTFRRRSDSCSVYIRFSSTVCKRIQTGTRTEEVPVFEIVCED